MSPLLLLVVFAVGQVCAKDKGAKAPEPDTEDSWGPIEKMTSSFPGAIIKLLDASSAAKSAQGQKDQSNLFIHKWDNVVKGYTMECRISSADPKLYDVKVFRGKTLIEHMSAWRFDLRLLESVHVDEKSTATTHILGLVMKDKTCKKRTYTAKPDGKGFDVKEDDINCPIRLYTNLWIWDSSQLATWGTDDNNAKSGAVISMPGKDSPDLSKAQAIHTYYNLSPPYSLTAYRLQVNGKEEYYATIHFHDVDGAVYVIEKAIKVSRFDQNMLRSIGIHNAEGDENEIQHLSFFKTDGTCIDRRYQWADKGSNTDVTFKENTAKGGYWTCTGRRVANDMLCPAGVFCWFWDVKEIKKYHHYEYPPKEEKDEETPKDKANEKPKDKH